jgi:hypothetical protein
MKTKAIAIILAGALSLVGCAKPPKQYEGTWYYDSDELASRPRYIEMQGNGVLRDYDGTTEASGKWRIDGDKIFLTLPDLSVEYPAERVGDALTLALPPPGAKLNFRHSDSIRFVEPLLGTWSNSNAELIIHEGGWALLRHQSNLSRIRIGKDAERITWSIRFFDTRLAGTITIKSDVEIEFRWPNDSIELLKRQK